LASRLLKEEVRLKNRTKEHKTKTKQLDQQHEN